jgi:glycosyl hydrolase family 3
VALHPQIDLATEPRWARASGTFGEDADLTSRLVTAYIEGLRGPGDRLGSDSVAAMVKHFPGGGPQKDGEDPHFPYGREQVYPGGYFDYHLRPFRAALVAGATRSGSCHGRITPPVPSPAWSPRPGCPSASTAADAGRSNTRGGLDVTDCTAAVEVTHPPISRLLASGWSA